jgi:hypothetical protein
LIDKRYWVLSRHYLWIIVRKSYWSLTLRVSNSETLIPCNWGFTACVSQWKEERKRGIQEYRNTVLSQSPKLSYWVQWTAVQLFVFTTISIVLYALLWVLCCEHWSQSYRTLQCISVYTLIYGLYAFVWNHQKYNEQYYKRIHHFSHSLIIIFY